MHTIIRRLALTALVITGLAAAPLAGAQNRQEAQLLLSTQVLEDLRKERDQHIPERLLQQAYAVAVVPDVHKAAFIFGARYGRGVLTVRDSTGAFSNPVFIDLSGGGVGFQVGVQETDVVLVFTTRKGVETIYNGELTLGGNASVAAGPVGRQGEAAVSTTAEILSYSMARGLFAGVSLDGTALTMNNASNREFYGREDLVPADVISGKVTRNDSATVQRFLAALKTSTGDAPASPPAGTAAAPAPQPAAPAPAPTAAESTRTFPLEDRSPGAEPPK